MPLTSRTNLGQEARIVLRTGIVYISKDQRHSEGRHIRKTPKSSKARKNPKKWDFGMCAETLQTLPLFSKWYVASIQQTLFVILRALVRIVALLSRITHRIFHWCSSLKKLFWYNSNRFAICKHFFHRFNLVQQIFICFVYLIIWPKCINTDLISAKEAIPQLSRYHFFLFCKLQ